jgi:uncharacterized protein YdhG (YjbR/CyaY superfamily)
MHKFKTVNEYLSAFPTVVRSKLESMREIVKKAAPTAEEVISYNMPAYRQKRVLVYFSAFKQHIGFYPTSSGINEFKSELSGYKFSKGAIQFPLDKPLPVKLISRIVRFRERENLDTTLSKKKST